MFPQATSIHFPGATTEPSTSEVSTHNAGGNWKGRRSDTWSKNRSNDADNHRRSREERANQLRREKRQERTTNERKKFKFDSKSDSGGSGALNSNFNRLYDVTVWQLKTEQLSSPSRDQRLSAMEYLRRILTVDRNPPLEHLLNSCTAIIPSMINLLRDQSAPEIQFEAAWAITNLACGDYQYVKLLLEHQIMLHLMEVVVASKEMIVKDQCLWALFNISTEDEACRALIHNEKYVMAILALLGIYVDPPDAPIPAKKKIPPAANPSLSVMRHCAFIFCNIIKLKELQAHYLLKGIFQAFAELLQSPDDEIISDIIMTIATTSQNNVNQIHLLLEFGIISRLCELIDIMSHVEQALHALASAAVTPNRLQCKTILYQFHNRHQNAGETETEREFLDNVNTSLFDYIVQYLKQRVEQHKQYVVNSNRSSSSSSSLSTRVDSTNSSCCTGSNNCQHNVMNSNDIQWSLISCGPSSSSSTVNNKLFKTLPGGKVLPPSKDPKSYIQPTQDMFITLEHVLLLQAPHFLLRKREYENHESMKTLLISLGLCCQYFMYSIHSVKMTVCAGACFCAVVETYGNVLVESNLNLMLECMVNIVQLQDDRVIYRALLIWQGYISTPHPNTPTEALHMLKPKLGILRFHPVQEISQLACGLSNQLSRLIR